MGRQQRQFLAVDGVIQQGNENCAIAHPLQRVRGRASSGPPGLGIADCGCVNRITDDSIPLTEMLIQRRER